jgi:hypothetical protein
LTEERPSPETPIIVDEDAECAVEAPFRLDAPPPLAAGAMGLLIDALERFGCAVKLLFLGS